MERKPYYISTAIAYTSARPHIGNTYEIILADAIARYKRAAGYDVYFQTGTDEHGQKIEEKAQAAGVTPQAYVDNVAADIKRIWDRMNTTYDKFVRTTDPMHVKKVQKIFKRLYDKGDIYKGTYEGKYCTPCESFWTESQLTDGNCPDCGRPCKDAQEEAYFFKMSKYADRLMEHIEAHPEFIQPESRKNEMVNNFLKVGLQDLCVSRTSFKWGIPVDFDGGHVVYVWLDALTNYITFCGYDPDGNHEPHYQKYWPADVHLIGKDIIRFHTIYWPIFLMALEEELPRQVFGHPWLLVGDGKMSKSVGNVIYADDLVEYFGVDAVRYYVLHEIPFANDGVITHELMCERINSDLANVLGNLVNRTIAMSAKYFEGQVMPPNAPEALDEELRQMALALPGKVEKHMQTLHVADAIDEIFTLLRRSNKYIDETMPWALAKDESKRDRLGTVLYHLLESIRFAAVMLEPYLPETSAKIFAQMGIQNKGIESLGAFDGMQAGAALGQASILFERIDIPKMLARIEEDKEKAAPKVQEKAAEKAGTITQIGIEDFAKVELRVAEIIACEPVPKANKLLCSQVDLGGEKRQIVSGIASWYKPEDLIGRKVILVSNLKPAKLRGVESQGMILCADGAQGEAVVLFVDGSVPNGAKIR